MLFYTDALMDPEKLLWQLPRLSILGELDSITGPTQRSKRRSVESGSPSDGGAGCPGAWKEAANGLLSESSKK